MPVLVNSSAKRVQAARRTSTRPRATHNSHARVGALTIHHPDWMDRHPSGSGQDTTVHWGPFAGRPWVAHRTVLDLKTNVWIWGLFMSTAMKAAVRLALTYNENLEVFKNTNFARMFDITQKLIKWTKAKVHVYSVSVFCLGKMQEHSETNQRCKDQLKDFRQSNSCRELFGIDGEPIEFEWNISQDVLHWRFSKRSKRDLQNQNIEAKNSRITRRDDSREDTGHSSAQVMSINGTAQYSRASVLLSRGILK